VRIDVVLRCKFCGKCLKNCYTLLFEQYVDFNRHNQGKCAVNSLLFLNATNIRMQLLPKLPTSIDRLSTRNASWKTRVHDSFGENTT
jgi:hypothetical protein